MLGKKNEKKVQKNFASENFFDNQKHFQVQKIFWVKNILVQRILGIKKFGVEKKFE